MTPRDGQMATVVRLLRRESRLSQRELGMLAGTSGPSIAAYESGAKEPRWSTVEQIAAATACTLEARLVPRTEGERLRRRRALRSRAVAAAVAAAAQRDFPAAQRLGRANLIRAGRDVGSKGASRWLKVWSAALEAGPEQVRLILLDPTDDGDDLRQMSPLAGLISDDERLAALAAVAAVTDCGVSEWQGERQPR